MKYKEAINELYQRRTKGIKLGLERVFSVLEKFGNPQNEFKSIHIAGTNGKGSVSKIIYSLLRAHELSVGVYTSPHLTRFTERIVVNDIEISEDDVLRLIEKIKPFGDDLTFFEYVTVMAFLYFKEKNIEYAVIETGMGGRLDATNVVYPEVSVITTIGFDHQEFLGDDIRSITLEKAGIIKKSIPVVLSNQNYSEVEEVIKDRANLLNSQVFIYGRDFSADLISINFHALKFNFFMDSSTCLKNLSLSLLGIHQIGNASVALKAFTVVYPSWDESSLREALNSVKMPGRLEIVSYEPLIIFDIAHNPDAAEALVNSLKNLTNKRPVLVFGMMKDKDVIGFIKKFENYAYKIVFTTPHYERALRYEELLRRANEFLNSLYFVSEPAEAFKEGLSLCKNNPQVYLLCTGSTYLIGELKEFLGESTLHRSLREFL